MVRVLEDPSDRSSPLVQLMDDRPSWLALSVEGKVFGNIEKAQRNRKSNTRQQVEDKENIAADPQDFAFIRCAKRQLGKQG